MSGRRLWAAGLWLAAGAASAADPRAGGTTLLNAVDARSTALGGAGTALTGELAGAFYNPAALATLEGPQALTQVESAPGDVKTGLLSFGRGTGRAGWAASVLYLDAGTVEIIPLAGSPTTRRAQQDLVGALSAAFSVWPGARVGVTVKGIQSRLAQEFTAAAGAADAGVLVDLPLHGLRLGAGVQNAGGKLTFRSEGDPLPTATRAGLSYEIVPGGDPEMFSEGGPWYTADGIRRSRFWMGADAVRDRWGAVSVRAGFEWDYARRAILRLGGRFGEDGEGLSGGVGFWFGAWRLDYAFQLVDELKDHHRFTLSHFWKQR